MERKKVLTGTLLIAAILIWGVIILKVVRFSKPGETKIVEQHLEKSIEGDGKDSLKMNYRDPFIGEFIVAEHDKKSGHPLPVMDVRKEPEASPVPNFSFKGMISNGSGTRALVLKNGSLYVVGIGELIGEFKIAGISPECMTLQNGKCIMDIKVK